MNKISKIAIPNRGEIAVRIIRGCHELGIKTALLHSEADQGSMAYRMSDERICIGSSQAKESYLNIDSVVEGAVGSQAQALHPGVGFLSENAKLAEVLKKKGILWIGPGSDVLSLFAHKKAFSNEVHQLGVPVLPSLLIEKEILSMALNFKAETGGFVLNEKNKAHRRVKKALDKIYEKASTIGYPLMVKITEGGGGLGLREVFKKEDLMEAIEGALREGRRTFQSEDLFLEKYLSDARHVEAQIFVSADGSCFYLGTRDCTIQRKHQKLIEEAPAFSLSLQMEEKIREATFKIMKHFKSYRSAGTLEFLVQGEEFYFIEINPRLQVEHTVTEMVKNVDLVKAQILTAQNKPLLWALQNLKNSFDPYQEYAGHAIECRILAEDYDKFLRDGSIWPSSGRLGSLFLPLGSGRRFDLGFEEGDEITHFYDSLIGKVIVWDESRIRAIQKMKKTLSETILFGVKTNISFLISILEHPDYIDGNLSTEFLSHLSSSFFEQKKNFSSSHLLYKGQEDLSAEDIKIAKKAFEHLNFNDIEKEKKFKPDVSSSVSTYNDSPWMHPWDKNKT